MADAQSILKLLDGLIDKVGLARAPAAESKAIYIGSYGYQFGHDFHDYTEDLKQKLLNPRLSQEQFLQLLDSGA